MSDRELPGFRYDPVRKRYFALTPEERLNPGTSNISREPHHVPSIRTRFKYQRFQNTPYLLYSRQLGNTSPTSFETDLLDMKVLKMKLSKEINLKEFRPMDGVLFMKANPQSIILQYKKDTSWDTVLAEYLHHFTPDEFRGNTFDDTNFESYVTVNDVCVGFNNSEVIMYVGNDMQLNFGIANTGVRPVHENNVSNNNGGFMSSSPIWCCACNDFTEKFFIGMKDSFTVYSLTGTSQIRDVFGKVYSLTNNKMGSVVYSGSSSGDVTSTDMRSHRPTSKITISSYGIQEMVLLEDQNQLICANSGGEICKFDIRVQKKVQSYKVHSRLPSINSLSVNEKHNLLCATGSDHVTRFWCLSNGGYPMNQIKPNSIVGDSRKTFSCFIGDCYKLSALIVHNSSAWVYDIYV